MPSGISGSGGGATSTSTSTTAAGNWEREAAVMVGAVVGVLGK